MLNICDKKVLMACTVLEDISLNLLSFPISFPSLCGRVQQSSFGAAYNTVVVLQIRSICFCVYCADAFILSKRIAC